MVLDNIIRTLKFSTITRTNPLISHSRWNSELGVQLEFTDIGLTYRGNLTQPWPTAEVDVSLEITRLFKRAIPVKTVLASQNTPKIAADTLLTSPDIQTILTRKVKKLLLPNPNEIVSLPLPLTGALITVGVGLVVLKNHYANNADPYLGQFYGVKCPKGDIKNIDTITDKKRPFYIEFILPNLSNDPNFLDPLYAKHPTVDRMIIFSDFLYYRKEMECSLKSLYIGTFFVAGMLPAMKISSSYATKLVAVYTQNGIILAIVRYIFFFALQKVAVTSINLGVTWTTQAVTWSIVACSFTFKRIVRVCSFLREKIGGFDPSLKP